jgi:hypothetical protein
MSRLTRSLARTALACTAMILLAACASPVRDAIQVSGNQEFTLRPGERAALPGQSSLRYIEVANDSRCPPTVQCVWAGDAEVKLVFEQAGKAADVVLHSANPAPQPMGPCRSRWSGWSAAPRRLPRCGWETTKAAEASVRWP